MIDSYTKLLLNMNSDFNDLSANNHTPAVTGATIDPAVKKMGAGSGKFVAASNQYATYPNHSDWDFQAGPLTIEFQVYFNTVARNHILVAYGDYTAGGGWVLWFDGTDLRFNYFTSGGPSSINIITAAWTPTVSTWYEVMLSKDGSDDYRFFVEGTQVGSTANNATTLPTSTEKLFIGAQSYNSSIMTFADVNLDEVRVSKGIARETSNHPPSTREHGVDVAFLNQQYALNTYTLIKSTLEQQYALNAPSGLYQSVLNQQYALNAPAGLYQSTLNQQYALNAPSGLYQSSLDQRYKLNGYPVRAPVLSAVKYSLKLTGNTIYDSDTKLMLPMNQNFKDASAMNRTPTVSGAVIDYEDKKFGEGAGKFVRADGQYVSFPNKEEGEALSTWPKGTEDFTVRFFVKRLGSLGIYQTVFAQTGDDIYAVAETFIIAKFQSDNTFTFWIRSGVTAYQVISTTIFDDLDIWYFIACMRDGDNLKLYVGNAQEGGDTDVTGISMNTSSWEFTVGRLGGNDMEYFDGRIDGFRVDGVAIDPAGFPPTQAYGSLEMAEIELPMGSYNTREQDAAPTSLSATVPNGMKYADSVTARSKGQLYVTRTGTDEDGNPVTEELTRVYLEKNDPDEGALSSSISLSGNRTTANTAPQGVEIEPEKTSSRTSKSGKREVKTKQAAISAGDQAHVDGQIFTIGEINRAVNTNNTEMTIKEK